MRRSELAGLMALPQFTPPKRGVVYGITHDEDGQPRARTVRTIKVSIGTPAGPDLHVYIDNRGTWKIREGYLKNSKRELRTHEFANKAEARKAYHQLRRDQNTYIRNYPEKLAYFTFSRPGPEGLEPDFDAIEAHGLLPTRINVIFVDPEPLEVGYQLWQARGLQCQGDGIHAMRRVELASDDDQLADQFRKAGKKWFPIVDKCALRGCEFANGDEATCKPRSKLSFMLQADIRLGGRAQFDSTSYRTMKELSDSILDLRMYTGNGDPRLGVVVGYPVQLVVTPFRATHGGKTSTAYSVHMEVAGEELTGLRRRLIEQAYEVREPVAQLPAATEEVDEVDESEVATVEAADFVEPVEPDTEEAEAITAHFYPEAEAGPDDHPPPDDPPPPDEEAGNGVPEDTATAEKTKAQAQALKQKIRNRRKPREEEF